VKIEGVKKGKWNKQLKKSKSKSNKNLKILHKKEISFKFWRFPKRREEGKESKGIGKISRRRLILRK
jgi:hypothetical protein